MAKTSGSKTKYAKPKSQLENREPKLPYCSTPNALRKFLKLVPSKPKPQRVNNALLSAWDLGGSNANSIIRVLKEVGLVDSSNQPTSEYDIFMDPKPGPSRLGLLIRERYAALFEASHAPHKESDETLKRLFNIHSGGAERTLQYQVATFKALCEFANFDSQDQISTSTPNTKLNSGVPSATSRTSPTVVVSPCAATRGPSKSSLHWNVVCFELQEMRWEFEPQAIQQNRLMFGRFGDRAAADLRAGSGRKDHVHAA